MDRDLLEITIPQLEQLYRSHKYTVTEVVRWYIGRIEKYNGIYRAVQTVDTAGALAAAGRQDADAKAGGNNFLRGANVGRSNCGEGKYQHKRPDHHRWMERLHDPGP